MDEHPIDNFKKKQKTRLKNKKIKNEIFTMLNKLFQFDHQIVD